MPEDPTDQLFSRSARWGWWSAVGSLAYVIIPPIVLLPLLAVLSLRSVVLHTQARNSIRGERWPVGSVLGYLVLGIVLLGSLMAASSILSSWGTIGQDIRDALVY